MDHEQMLVKFECRKCKKDFGSLESSCGLGWSWGLYRCPHCHQLHAMAFIGGFIPDEVLNDKEIIVIESFRAEARDSGETRTTQHRVGRTLPNESRQPSWCDDGLDDAVIGSLP